MSVNAWHRRGRGCGIPRWPGVYSRVSHAYDWIEDLVCEHSEDVPSYMGCPRSLEDTSSPTRQASASPTQHPTSQPTDQPTLQPTAEPTTRPTLRPTTQPTEAPSMPPTAVPSQTPSRSQQPSHPPSVSPSDVPSASPSTNPTASPAPSTSPTMPVGDSIFIGWFPPKGLRHCEGDCNLDGDCADGLVCFRRRRGERIPGCTNDPILPRGADFCVRKEEHSLSMDEL
mmetsp:Transcript_20131/g.56037  ORF Transcript_20131/g.56037 Transcript_20131/m.56037 type:complete len:227 (+) Transcript_20131:227-907(+)